MKHSPRTIQDIVEEDLRVLLGETRVKSVRDRIARLAAAWEANPALPPRAACPSAPPIRPDRSEESGGTYAWGTIGLWRGPSIGLWPVAEIRDGEGDWRRLSGAPEHQRGRTRQRAVRTIDTIGGQVPACARPDTTKP